MQTAQAGAHLQAGRQGEDPEGRECGASTDGGQAKGARPPAEGAGAGARKQRLPH